MKFKVFTIFFSIFLSSLVPAFGQGSSTVIKNLKILPTFPDKNDPIQLISDVTFLYSPCAVDSFKLSHQDSIIELKVYYNVGVVAAICNTTDTFAIGTLDPGNYTLKYFAKRSKLPNDSMVDSVQFSVSNISGLKDIISLVEELVVYPNPGNKVEGISMSLISEKQTKSTVQIFSVTGSLVFDKQLQLKQGKSIYKLKTNKLKAGFYTLQLITEQNLVVTRKFVVK